MTGFAQHEGIQQVGPISRALERSLQSRGDFLERLPMGICACDLDGYLIYYNRRAAELWGQEPAKGDRRHRYCGAYRAYGANGELLTPIQSPMAELLAAGYPIRNRETEVERPDGGRLTLLSSLEPLYGDSSRMIGGVNCFQDITPRKVAELSLLEREQWERKQAEQQKSFLLRELAHRVNNAFAVILAVTQQSLRSAPSAEAFAEAFTGRLHALADAHNLLLAGGWAGADLGELARGQLSAFGCNGGERVVAEGPPVTLRPTEAIALGSVLHELGTNACKFGALSTEGGTVKLSWELRDGRIDFIWIERGGPSVSQPSRNGLGSKLIERGIPGADVDWRFEPEGVVCSISFPLEKPIATSDADSPVLAAIPSAGQAVSTSA
jgi:PAS domain S-box-containing protein